MKFDLRSLLRIISVLTVLYGTVCTRRQNRCQRSEIDIATDQGVKIEPVAISRIDVNIEGEGIGGKGDGMTFDFKTTSPSGVLFYARRYKNSAELIALSMAHGRLFYTIRCSFAHAHLRLPGDPRMDDGQWHTVTFHRKRFQALIEVDKKPYFINYVNCGGFNSFVFGGVEPKDTHRISRAVGKVAHFEGCLRNLDTTVPFKNQISYTAVSVCK